MFSSDHTAPATCDVSKRPAVDFKWAPTWFESIRIGDGVLWWMPHNGLQKVGEGSVETQNVKPRKHIVVGQAKFG